MQADEDFNIRFVAIVKRHRCLYDTKVPEYRNKDYQEKAWHEICKDTKESVLHCKERWRNLRACLSRYIKQQSSSDPQHKPYYLSEHMSYLLPFLKSNRQSSARNRSSISNSSYGGDLYDSRHLDTRMKQSVSDFEEDPRDDEYKRQQPMSKVPTANLLNETSDTESTDSATFAPDVQIDTRGSCEILFPTSMEDILHQPPLPKRIKTEPISLNGAVIQSAMVTEPKLESGNADMEFFRSIIPDISGMTALQRRKFKIGILQLIDDVYDKYPPSTEIPRAGPSNNHPNGFWSN